MADYIDRDTLIKKIRSMPRTINPDLVQYSLVKGIISNIEQADVAPVVHGHWEPIIDPYGVLEGWLCGCGRETKEMTNYCPNCGVKMDR